MVCVGGGGWKDSRHLANESATATAEQVARVPWLIQQGLGAEIND